MRLLLIGCNGQVGWELQRSLASLGELITLDRVGRCDMVGDFCQSEQLAQTVRAVAPDAIVNAAAYTAVDRAETEPDLARTINAHGPAVLAREARALGAWLVHYSTDYVFDGSGDKAWEEDDPPGPVNVYGATKLEGECAIREHKCQHLIFRTSWVYASRGHNFIRTVLRLARENEQLRIIDDQVGAPTSAELIADVTAHALRSTLSDPGLGGTYHLAARGETSWWGYARYVVDIAGRGGARLRATPERVLPVPSQDFPTPAQRPLNSRLKTTRLEQTFDLLLPSWERGVSRVVTEILNIQGDGEALDDA